jgi:hypothetical protein
VRERRERGSKRERKKRKRECVWEEGREREIAHLHFPGGEARLKPTTWINPLYDTGICQPV